MIFFNTFRGLVRDTIFWGYSSFLKSLVVWPILELNRTKKNPLTLFATHQRHLAFCHKSLPQSLRTWQTHCLRARLVYRNRPKTYSCVSTADHFSVQNENSERPVELVCCFNGRVSTYAHRRAQIVDFRYEIYRSAVANSERVNLKFPNRKKCTSVHAHSKETDQHNPSKIRLLGLSFSGVHPHGRISFYLIERQINWSIYESYNSHESQYSSGFLFTIVELAFLSSNLRKLFRKY